MYHPRYENKAEWHKLYSTKQWQSIRHHRLQADPLCKFCLEQGRATPANTVDHIRRHQGNEALFFDYSNTQALCKRCHDSVKQRFEKSGVWVGCDADGLPLDPKHHWK